MAAPTVGASGTYRQGVSGAPAFANPGSVVANSVVVICFYLDSSTTVTDPGSGFAHAPGSPLRVGAGLGGEHSINVIWKRASGSESADYTVTFSGSQYSNGRAFRVDGCVTSGSPWDTNSGTGAAVATDTTNNTTAPAVSMTTQNNDQLNWYMTSNWSGGTWTPSTGFTELMDSGDGTCTVNSRSQTTAGGTGSVSATCTGSNKRSAWLGSLLSTAISSGTSLNAGNDAVAVAANAATLAVGAPAGNDAVSVAANAATLAVGAQVGNDAVSVAAQPVGLAVARSTGGAALSVGAFNASIISGTLAAPGNAAVSIGAYDVTLRLGGGLAGNAHGPLPTADGSIVVHTGTIAGAIT